jgi:hypothetical protein
MMDLAVMTGQPSVDTVGLLADASCFSLSGEPDLEILTADQAHGSVPNSTLWKERSGRRVKGVCAFRRIGPINVQIRAIPQYGRAPRLGCFIQFSAPKMFYGHNAYGLNQDEFRRVIYMVDEKLTSIGVQVDLLSSLITRIDIARNVPLEYQTADYFSLLRWLNVPYQKPGKSSPTYALHRNKRRSTAFYDKIAEMRRNQSAWVGDVPVADLLRSELRFRKASVVRNAFNPMLGAPANQSLYLSNLIANYDACLNIHGNEMRKIFKISNSRHKSGHTGDEFTSSSLAQLNGTKLLSRKELESIQVQKICDRYGRQALRYLQEVQGLEFKLKTKDPREEMMLDLLKTRGELPSSTLSKYRAKQQELLQFAILPNNVPYATLFDELTQKLC